MPSGTDTVIELERFTPDDYGDDDSDEEDSEVDRDWMVVRERIKNVSAGESERKLVEEQGAQFNVSRRTRRTIEC